MKFSFIHISDHHLQATETALLRGFSPGYAFRMVMRHIAENQTEAVDFIVTTGDIADQGSEANYRTFAQMLNLPAGEGKFPGPLKATIDGQETLPLYCLPGNHDDRLNFYRVLFPQTDPIPAFANVTFVYQGVQFICLDMGPGVKAAAHLETLNFLSEALATGLPAIIMLHHQLVPMGARWLDQFIADDVDQFWSRITGRNVLGIFTGHVHMTYDNIVAGVPVYGIRSTAYQFGPQNDMVIYLQPPQYRLITIKDGVLTTQIFEVPL